MGKSKQKQQRYLLEFYIFVLSSVPIGEWVECIMFLSFTVNTFFIHLLVDWIEWLPIGCGSHKIPTDRMRRRVYESSYRIIRLSEILLIRSAAAQQMDDDGLF